MTTKNEALAMWEDRITAIDKEIQDNRAEGKKIAHDATAEIREKHKALIARKGKMVRALKAVKDDLDEHPIDEMGE